jgi:Protein kinase domain/Leucine rich repeat
MNKDNCQLHDLRQGNLTGARTLRLSGLKKIPDEVFDLGDSLEILDLSDGFLSSLPNEMSKLKKLRILFCSHNRFEEIPEILSDCRELSQIGFRANSITKISEDALPQKLRWLIVTQNNLSTLPNALAERPLLQKLMLSGNELTELPESLQNASGLELLRLSANRLEYLPQWLLNLPRLAWISWSGNPLEPNIAPKAQNHISWDALEIGAILGQGASGHVYESKWLTAYGEPNFPVAVKIFKAAMTSDGLPKNEIITSLTAGQHENLLGAIGRVEDHPSGQEALVLPLLPRSWEILANPPDFSSCTRDIYEPEFRIEPEKALEILRCITRAMVHLHNNAILHGDLYAHNILWDVSEGKAVLSDFGAACVVPHNAVDDGWRKIETRALGLLIEELTSHVKIENNLVKKLREISVACIQDNCVQRPLMQEILDFMSELSRGASSSIA